MAKNKYIVALCKDCFKPCNKRKDSLKTWQGRCRSCARKHVHACTDFTINATKKANTIHGDAKNKYSKGHWLYGRWLKMRRRCKEYPTYIAKGIQVCDEWLLSYPAFKKWAEENGAEQDLELDRTDNYGDYCPSNCRWVTHQVNCQNKWGFTCVITTGDNHGKTQVKLLDQNWIKAQKNTARTGFKFPS